MQAIKAVKQNYVPTSDLLVVLEEFRKMVNECVQMVILKVDGSEVS